MTTTPANYSLKRQDTYKEGKCFPQPTCKGQEAQCPGKLHCCQDFSISSSKPHTGVKWKEALFKYQEASMEKTLALQWLHHHPSFCLIQLCFQQAKLLVAVVAPGTGQPGSTIASTISWWPFRGLSAESLSYVDHTGPLQITCNSNSSYWSPVIVGKGGLGNRSQNQSEPNQTLGHLARAKPCFLQSGSWASSCHPNSSSLVSIFFSYKNEAQASYSFFPRPTKANLPDGTLRGRQAWLTCVLGIHVQGLKHAG